MSPFWLSVVVLERLFNRYLGPVHYISGIFIEVDRFWRLPGRV